MSSIYMPQSVPAGLHLHASRMPWDATCTCVQAIIMLAWHCSPSGTQLPSLTGNMCCSLDSLIGDGLPDIALLAWLIVLAVQVDLFAESLSPLDVPHLQAKSRTWCSHKPATEVYNDAKGLAPLETSTPAAADEQMRL